MLREPVERTHGLSTRELPAGRLEQTPLFGECRTFPVGRRSGPIGGVPTARRSGGCRGQSVLLVVRFADALRGRGCARRWGGGVVGDACEPRRSRVARVRCRAALGRVGCPRRADVRSRVARLGRVPMCIHCRMSDPSGRRTGREDSRANQPPRESGRGRGAREPMRRRRDRRCGAEGCRCSAADRTAATVSGATRAGAFGPEAESYDLRLGVRADLGDSLRGFVGAIALAPKEGLDVVVDRIVGHGRGAANLSHGGCFASARDDREALRSTTRGAPRACGRFRNGSEGLVTTPSPGETCSMADCRGTAERLSLRVSPCAVRHRSPSFHRIAGDAFVDTLIPLP